MDYLFSTAQCPEKPHTHTGTHRINLMDNKDTMKNFLFKSSFGYVKQTRLSKYYLETNLKQK